MSGLVSLIGVGPGDPGLLTLRGQRALRLADVVLYDALVHPAVLDHAPPLAERLFVGKRRGADSTPQDAINHMLLFRASQGKRVARLKGGDPLLFGRGAEEMEFLASHGVRYEVIPGITAALGATAYAGIPLSHRDLSSSIALVTSTEAPGRTGSRHPWSALATSAQTVVFYMGLANLARDLASLIAHGRDPSTPAAVIANGTHPEQAVVVGTLETLPGLVKQASLKTPAMVIVGEVVSLRERLRWWDNRPLSGRSVAVTQAAEQARDFAEQLRDEGAEAVVVPLLAFAPPSDEGPLHRALDALATKPADVVVFTSQNGVARWFEALSSRGLDARSFGRSLVGAIGPATAEALRVRGIVADLVPAEAVGESMAASIVARLGDRIHGARVLLARAEVGRDVLPAKLREHGATVDVVPVYKTVDAPEAEVDHLVARLEAGTLDAVTLTASSAAEKLVAGIGARAVELLSGTVVASIGPVTTATLRGLGVRVDVEANPHSTSGLLDALVSHFHTKASP